MVNPAKTLALTLLCAVLMIPTALASSTAWEKCSWNGETAWSSSCDKTLAVVTLDRSRLIYLGALDGSLNLLSAPIPAAAPKSASDSPNWGGHRFWLGPQKRWVWPPLPEWEHLAAESVQVQGGILRVQHKRLNPEYPAILREYAWENGKLRCTARWKDDGRPYFGMHVVAVNTPFVITTRRVAWSEVPEGVVDVQMDAPRNTGVKGHPAIKFGEGSATITAGIQMLKSGYVPQALTTERPLGWKISVEPGPNEGIAITSPDFGYLSQIWVGASHVDLAELEQLTPYLIGGRDGWCSSTIYIQAGKQP